MKKQYILWPHDEADRIIRARESTESREPVVLETGFGPSGPPHLGTCGEIARTSFVAFALNERGVETHLIAFSDDMDGLRRPPTGFPKSLESYVGKPLCNIPDPFGEHESYSANMNARLREMAEHFNIPIQFRSSSVEYARGAFNNQIAMVLRNSDTIASIMSTDLSESTLATWHPFLPICERCGRVYTTRVLEVDPASLQVHYTCDRTVDGVSGCGNIATMSALDGGGKLAWKVDWASRWAAFGVDYEIHGKDLIRSCDEVAQLRAAAARNK